MNGIDPSLFWALLLLLLGLGCIVLEMFIPSAGMLGVLATLSLITALVMAFSSGLWAGAAMTLAVTILVPMLLALAVKYWPHTPFGKMILLRRPENPEDVLPDTEAYRSLHDLIGSIAIAKSDMYPSGMIFLNGRTYEAIASGMPIDAGQTVKVVALDTQRLVVRLDTSASATIKPPASAPSSAVPPGIEDPFA
jgi:membrane-bound ClpP family serine protease